MAKSNRDRVSEVMDALKDGLAPYVVREYARVFGNRLIAEINDALTTGAYGGLASTTADGAVREMDVQACLNLMQRRWDQVFKTRLSKSERAYVGELQDARTAWAHQKPISNDDAHRAADTAARLLEAVGAPDQAKAVREVASDLLRLRFEAEQKQSGKPTRAADPMIAPTLTTPGLKPWRMVVKPHPDVMEGRYILGDFVANIADVMQGKAAVEYADPKEFFRRTYLTEGLRDLLITGVRRLTGQGGDPVVQLQTAFGGGKTHSMLALYHLFGGKIGFSEIPGGEYITNAFSQIDDKIHANRAVIVGLDFSPTQPRQYADCTTHTLWGDIAYQLGGRAAYALVERDDLAAVNPGAETLTRLLEQHGPALIIIDELVAFARNLYGVTERLAAGSFDAIMSFVQSLTEAVKRSSDAMLLVSIPESDIEIGGDGGKAALDMLAKTIGRIESVWKPVTPNESFEIVRRRLFSSDIDYAARDAVVSAFREMYAGNSGEFPSGAGEGEYFRRLRDAYPIHPELFDRLYLDWSTLDRFQRTRGVLRLMATVIHRLWNDNDQSLMIMPGSIPLFAPSVRNELLRYLPDGWSAIVDADIDGDGSRPYQLDKSVPTLGQYTAARRVGRSIFVGSAPSVAGQSVRGVEEVRIRIATVQPGEQLAAFNDALRRMANQLTYLYTDGSRYWYDTRPTVNRMAQDRAQNIAADEVYKEAVARLRAVKARREDFGGAHVAPQTSGDIADEARARVVVLPPEYAHKRGAVPSEAQRAAQEIVENRGTAPRLYRNMLVFIAPDAGDAEAWEKALREYLAWRSIRDEAEPLNLDAQQRKQVEANCKRTEETVLSRLQETYSWLIVPVQPEPTSPIELQAVRISGQDSFFDRAARKLRSSEWLIPRWSPDNLRIELDRYLWRDQPHVGLKQLWEYLSRYCYLPRLYSEEVLIEAIRDGIARPDAPFGYATMISLDGSYKGLVYRQPAPSIYFDDNAVIVRPEVAQAQIDAEQRRQAASGSGVAAIATGAAAPSGDERQPAAPPPPKRVTRYHGTVEIDPQRGNKEMATVIEEIVQRLTGLTGTNVTITVEISAVREAGFDDATIRTISENSRTLKFRNHGFEGE
jgi:predicted AAA+ superfamily ATPase